MYRRPIIYKLFSETIHTVNGLLLFGVGDKVSDDSSVWMPTMYVMKKCCQSRNQQSPQEMQNNQNNQQHVYVTEPWSSDANLHSPDAKVAMTQMTDDTLDFKKFCIV
jgi:hypothetical protein